MKIYTKTGDAGTTALFGGTRVKKYNLRIESYGNVDELNSYIGLIKDQDISIPIKDRLNIPKIDNASILFLEEEIDKMDLELPQMTHFILPGGHQSVSFCHIARCICRRAERLVVELNDQENINIDILKYLNRLSDYLFTLARKLSKDLSVAEIKWIPTKN